MYISPNNFMKNSPNVVGQLVIYSLGLRKYKSEKINKKIRKTKKKNFFFVKPPIFCLITL